MTINKYWHTLRHLRPVQFYGRIWSKLNRPNPDMRPAPMLRSIAGLWQPAVTKPSSMTGTNAFRFLNEAGCVETTKDWNTPDKAKLWLYNLHYFDDLNAVNASERTAWHDALIDRWIMENPPGNGNGWEPYPTSLRIVNWIKWVLAGNEVTLQQRHSLAVQIRYLRNRLEWHLLGNHLFANAKALVFAGLFFEGDEAAGWRNLGLSILAREIPEQILADGGHFELSPMYHAIILEDILDLINLAHRFPGIVSGTIVGAWREDVNRLRAWLKVMVHPDGDISFFNDAAFGIAGSPVEIEAYARRLDLSSVIAPANGVTRLTDSGYVRVQQGDMVAILDLAQVGPDYLPGHAHADTLSFEFSLRGKRVIVNSGTSVYGNGPERLRQRATASHNTVEVDGKNSSEVWGGFRVARRAHPVGLKIHANKGGTAIECSHDGYCRLYGRPVHKRKWRFDAKSVAIDDTVLGDFETAIARYYLHPNVLAKGDGIEGELSLYNGCRISWTTKGGIAKLRPSTWHPEFGLEEENQCLEVTLKTSHCTTIFSW